MRRLCAVLLVGTACICPTRPSNDFAPTCQAVHEADLPETICSAVWVRRKQRPDWSDSAISDCSHPAPGLQNATARAHVLALRMRGGANSLGGRSRSISQKARERDRDQENQSIRAQMEERMKEERVKMAEEEDRIASMQERKKRERAEANRLALVKVEKEEEQLQLVRKKRRRLPEVPTLEDLAAYGKEMVAENDTDEAMLSYSRILQIDPTDANALFNLAVLYEDAHEDLPTAEEMLTRAAEAPPEAEMHAAVLMRLAKINLARRGEMNVYGARDQDLIDKRDEAAEQAFRKILSLQPANVEALTSLGSMMWHFKEDADAAQDLFSRAVQYNPGASEAFASYAAFLDEAKGDCSGALLLFKRAVQLAPSDTDTLWLLASFLHHSGV